MPSMCSSERILANKVARRLLRKKFDDADRTISLTDIVSEIKPEYHTNYPFVVAILRKRVDHKNIAVVGVAKYNPNDVALGHAWDEDLGKQIAHGKAIKSFVEQVEAPVESQVK